MPGHNGHRWAGGCPCRYTMHAAALEPPECSGEQRRNWLLSAPATAARSQNASGPSDALPAPRSPQGWLPGPEECCERFPSLAPDRLRPELAVQPTQPPLAAGGKAAAVRIARTPRA